MRRSLLVGLILTTVALAATLAPACFLGAGPGVDVPFESVPLPQPMAAPAPAAGPGLLQGLSLESAFTPTLHELLEGETVITSGRQMREVWKLLFAEPYDASLFDFDESFVVLMGGGAMVGGSFDISAVELVQAEYSEPAGPGGGTATETFLSVTSTTFLPGVQQQDPPPPTWRCLPSGSRASCWTTWSSGAT